MTPIPFIWVKDSIVARALADTVTEWMPKMPAKPALTSRDAVTTTESFGVRSLLDDTACESAGLPLFAYSPFA